MTAHPGLLETARHLILAREAEWAGTGIFSEIETSPNEHAFHSLSWILDGPEFSAQLVIWEDGRSELDLIDVAAGEVRSEHREVGEEGDLRSTLDTVVNWVVRTWQ